jgi:hypothetical protein
MRDKVAITITTRRITTRMVDTRNRIGTIIIMVESTMMISLKVNSTKSHK